MPASDLRAAKNHKVSGWAWSENIGWLSLNCYNDGLLNKCLSTDYGVDFDKNTRAVSGFAWSEYGGWVCFGKTCIEAGFTTAPDGSESAAGIVDNGLVSGFVNWTALAENGWLKLLGPAVSLSDKKVSCRNCAKLKGETREQCGFCFTDKSFNGAKAICENCKKCEFGECGSCSQCYQYGVGLDYSTNELVGWAWNENGDKTGFGWLQFHPATDKTTANAPYLQTVGGDVYAQKGIGGLSQGAAPEGVFNATYLLQSDGSIVHFSSACEGNENCEGGKWVENDAGALSLPKRETGYRAELGVIDLKGLFAGQYGEVKIISIASQISSFLKGRVYYSKNDLTVDSIKTFFNGTEQSGAGTVIVKGDLYIKANLFYQNTTVKDVKKLTSIGWLVVKRDDGTGGNIYIAPNVTSVVGSFYAENKISTGTFGDPSNEQKLKVSGLMIAKEFAFERDYFNLETKEPSERVIYDGRVIANPAPGFQSLAKALPIWK